MAASEKWCTCGRIQVGNRPVSDDGPRHWHPECPMHGEQSAWYRSRRRAISTQTVSLQREAARARREEVRDDD